ncbi:hypothetical protein SISSUDRAFT_1038050 [Sistotremastrum suecicum HHB10207 ss-3]|uniref:Uncharacterized protein n=1 Tax=Sistotremastrum suecicum HHB10207 ss-3 TaxID=1314776 RepID=A0A165X9Z0_9AGAM|nr:hypothetical protein SISSUDRAFT_1038050 [Sistotremastrum suecicum HHB10207 ss-3]
MVQRWTTEAQLVFLDARVNAYLDAKSHGADEREAYLNRTFDDFIAEWPLASIVFSPPVSASDPESVTQLREAALRARLKNWFINHTRDTSSRGGTTRMNLMQPRPRKPRAVNAYASLYGKERGLEQKISAAYTKYIDQLPPGADAKRQLTVREESLRALYAAEPQDVKDAVEAFRNRPPPAPWMDDLADDVTPDEEEVAMLMYLLRNQRSLPGTCKLIVDNLHRMTGLTVLLTVSGLDFRVGGKITTTWWDAGVTAAERGNRAMSFPDMYPDAVEDLVTKISRHSQKVWPMELREGIRESLSGLNIDDAGEESDVEDSEDEAAKSGPKRPKKSAAAASAAKKPVTAATSTKVPPSAKSSSSSSNKKPKQTFPFGPARTHIKKTPRDPLGSEPDFDAEPGEEIKWRAFNEADALPKDFRFWFATHAHTWHIKLVVHRTCTKARLRELYVKQLAILKEANCHRIEDLPSKKRWIHDLSVPEISTAPKNVPASASVSVPVSASTIPTSPASTIPTSPASTIPTSPASTTSTTPSSATSTTPSPATATPTSSFNAAPTSGSSAPVLPSVSSNASGASRDRTDAMNSGPTNMSSGGSPVQVQATTSVEKQSSPSAPASVTPVTPRKEGEGGGNADGEDIGSKSTPVTPSSGSNKAQTNTPRPSPINPFTSSEPLSTPPVSVAGQKRKAASMAGDDGATSVPRKKTKNPPKPRKANLPKEKENIEPAPEPAVEGSSVVSGRGRSGRERKPSEKGAAAMAALAKGRKKNSSWPNSRLRYIRLPFAHPTSVVLLSTPLGTITPFPRYLLYHRGYNAGVRATSTSDDLP